MLVGYLALIYTMLLWAPTFQHFFRNRIGGDLGELLLGLSLPLSASSPFVLFFAWMIWRGRQQSLRCMACRHSFASHKTFLLVRDTGKCPGCGAQQFETDPEIAPLDTQPSPDLSPEPDAD